jgi:hypothetical protein
VLWETEEEDQPMKQSISGLSRVQQIICFKATIGGQLSEKQKPEVNGRLSLNNIILSVGRRKPEPTSRLSRIPI